MERRHVILSDVITVKNTNFQETIHKLILNHFAHHAAQILYSQLCAASADAYQRDSRRH